MTMKELAELAGVSSSAVSRYLNGGSLSQDKRERIRIAIEQTGYQPDAAAQMLRTKTTDYVGLIVPKLDSDAVTRVTRGASQTLFESGYLGLLADTGNDPNQEIAFLKLFQNRKVAGIIMMGTILTPNLEDILKVSPVPIVVVGQHFPLVPCVYHDDYGAACELVSLMLKKGRKHIAMIGVTAYDIAVGQKRREGAEDAMRNFGLDPADLYYCISDFTLEGGRQAMLTLLDEHADIDGVICATDRIAFGAMEVLRSKGLRVPEDVSIVGMDDNWACEHILPNLTSAHFYYKTSGETAASLLVDMIQNANKTGPIMQTMLGYSIKERDSV